VTNTAAARQPRMFPGSTQVWMVAVPSILVVIAIPLFGSEPLVLQATDILIFALFVTSLNLAVGMTGMVSMGHAAFFAVAGYAGGLCVRNLGWSMPVAFLIGPLLAGAIAAAVGVLCVRLSHSYFIMLTLAFGQLVYIVIWKWQKLTGGDDGLVGFSPSAVLSDARSYYCFVAVVVCAGVAILRIIGRSPFGVTLAAIRDNPSRTSAIGVDVHAFQLAAFVISGVFVGIAGVLQAFFHRGMFPDAAGFKLTADALVAIVLGGAQYFMGPIVGAIVFGVLRLSIPQLTVYWSSVVGIIIIVIALFRPAGLMSLFPAKDART
jgi:branched-chain amino acid transport system permease protein